MSVESIGGLRLCVRKMMNDFTHNDQNAEMKIDKRREMLNQIVSDVSGVRSENHDLRSHTDQLQTNIDTKNAENAGALLIAIESI